VKTLTIRDGCFPSLRAFNLAGERTGEGPRLIEWRRVSEPPADVYTDLCIPEAPSGSEAIAWLIEPPTMPGKDGHYSWVEQNRHAFRTALTYRADLIERDPSFYRFYPHGGAWVQATDYPVRKTSLVSLLASPKRLSAGHRLRHKAIERLGDRLDAFGPEYRHSGDLTMNKLLALIPYFYSVVIENGRLDFYFSEKLIDAFLTRTVPIYWGCPSIGRFFDHGGMLRWETLDDLEAIVSGISPDHYRSLSESIEHNYHEALRYVCAEDWIASTYPNLLEG